MSTDDWLSPEEFGIARSYVRSAKALFVQLDKDLQRNVGMPRTFFEILWLLNGAPGNALRMSELAERTGSQPSAMTHAIARLEKDGEVRREHCPDDRRGWLAVLTDQGRETLNVACPAYAKSIRQHFLGALTKEQAEIVVVIGETLLEHLRMKNFPTAAIEQTEGHAILLVS